MKDDATEATLQLMGILGLNRLLARIAKLEDEVEKLKEKK